MISGARARTRGTRPPQRRHRRTRASQTDDVRRWHPPSLKTTRTAYLGCRAGRSKHAPRRPDHMTGRRLISAPLPPGPHLDDPHLKGLDTHQSEPRKHDLRHSFASRAVALGESQPVSGKLFGHSQVQTTARYAHFARLAPDPVKAVAARVGAGSRAPFDQPARRSNIPAPGRTPPNSSRTRKHSDSSVAALLHNEGRLVRSTCSVSELR